MKKSKPNNKKWYWLYVLLLAASFIISVGGSFLYLKDEFAFESEFIADIESTQYKEALAHENTGSSRLYRSTESISPVKGGTVFRKDALLVIVEDFIKKHVEPYGVRLLDLYLDREGVIYMDFGSELKKNFRGDVHEELNILAGLYKGIKLTIPGLTSLKILIDGSEAESFGGHIDISKPVGEEVTYGIR